LRVKFAYHGEGDREGHADDGGEGEGAHFESVGVQQDKSGERPVLWIFKGPCTPTTAHVFLLELSPN